MQYIGLDNANGHIKLYDGLNTLVYENRLTQLTGCEFDVFDEGQTTYEYNNEKYILSSSGISSAGRNSGRYLTEEYLVECLIAVSQVIRDSQIVLTVGVPARDYDNAAKRDEIAKHLRGRHILTVNGQAMVIDFICVMVTCEPLGTLLDMIYDDSTGDITENTQLMDYSYCCIDIGYGTTDILCTINGIRAVRMASMDVGIMDVVNQYLQLINKRLQGTDKRFTHKDIGCRPEPEIQKYGESWDFTSELDKAKKLVMKQINAAIAQNGINTSEWDRVLFTGGGSMCLREYLRLSSNARVYPLAQEGNARGYWKYGMMVRG